MSYDNKHLDAYEQLFKTARVYIYTAEEDYLQKEASNLGRVRFALNNTDIAKAINQRGESAANAADSVISKGLNMLGVGKAPQANTVPTVDPMRDYDDDLTQRLYTTFSDQQRSQRTVSSPSSATKGLAMRPGTAEARTISTRDGVQRGLDNANNKMPSPTRGVAPEASQRGAAQATPGGQTPEASQRDAAQATPGWQTPEASQRDAAQATPGWQTPQNDAPIASPQRRWAIPAAFGAGALGTGGVGAYYLQKQREEADRRRNAAFGAGIAAGTAAPQVVSHLGQAGRSLMSAFNPQTQQGWR